ncbi:hypothetical protein SCLCIDRAFT_1209597 [Scleroderma citrinum Foug A]|uniref:Uncharacterized protein n=1 Tax=Scleroderma citrinum Foug A TaxID=1036808 RepID=A0A0C3EJV4_9AGAM|nr:hypothetical protein SCLCIDRAFT_1209597 [Scleroderma citrinum Foug A]
MLVVPSIKIIANIAEPTYSPICHVNNIFPRIFRDFRHPDPRMTPWQDSAPSAATQQILLCRWKILN